MTEIEQSAIWRFKIWVRTTMHSGFHGRWISILARPSRTCNAPIFYFERYQTIHNGLIAT